MGILGYEPLEGSIGQGPDDAKSARRGAEIARISAIEPGGVGARAELAPGDELLAINGEPIRDPIDLLFHGSEPELELSFRRAGEKRARRKSLTRSPGESLGIVLEDFRVRVCNNQCVFCFVHQNPRGLRRGIYFKDGDFRMSFMHGNYITMTNMGKAEFDRIIEQRLSPMYVSVHATDHALRLRMLGSKEGLDVLDGLRELGAGGIEFHTQIVLCPGWNDGPELDRTLNDLAKLRPSLLSIAIVPLGLTDHREGLPEMAPVTPSFCKRVIAQVEPRAAEWRKTEGEPVVYLADEFYITAGKAPPDYADLPVMHQLENGVGMVWEFMRPWRSLTRRLPERLERPRSVAIMTGLLGARVLRRVRDRLRRVEGLSIELIPVINGLFGRAITVSGLLSGGDFLRAIAENPGFDEYLIPGNALRAEGEVFLDNMSLDELKRRCGANVRLVEGDCEDLIAATLGTSVAPPPVGRLAASAA